MEKEEITFNNTSKAFIAKTDVQLKHSLFLFKLLQSQRLVAIFSKFTELALKLKLPISYFIKATVFKQFCGGENITETKEVIENLQKSKIGSILDYSVEGKEIEQEFDKTTNEVLKIIELAKNNPAIPYTSLKLTGIMSFSILEKINAGTDLNEQEKEEFIKAKKRLKKICDAAYFQNVPIYLDAEESWIQGVIDDLAKEMMLLYNKEKAIVLTTLQMYRWDRLRYLQELIKLSGSEKIFIGIKLVRGAYLEKENKRALECYYKSPIQHSKQDTDNDFDTAVTICLENIDLITLCAGTHNEMSTMHLIREMKRLNIPNNHPNVYFSQLYGMSDHISYNLSNAGYNVTKYLPYGPVKSVIPYLIRRAQENTAIAGQMSRELKLIIEETKRRAEQKLLR